MKQLAVILSFISILLFQGCATITRGTTQSFSIDSDPSGADVRLSTGLTCITPCDLDLKRKPGFTAVFNKEGYKEKSIEVDSSIGGKGTAGFLGNALIGGPIGAGIDLGTGAMNDLTPNPLMVTLEPSLARKEEDINPTMLEDAPEAKQDLENNITETQAEEETTVLRHDPIKEQNPVMVEDI